MEDDKNCDVSAEAPPRSPLPPHGVLFKKRNERNINNKSRAAAQEAAMAQKRKLCSAEPLNSKCIPESILLPIKPVPSTAGRYLEADAPDLHAGTYFLKNVKVRKGKVDFPGWLIELTNEQLQSVVDARDLLASSRPLCEIIDAFYQAIIGLDGTIPYEEVKQILKRVPLTSKGWSFSHFMFIAGNPSYAKKKGVIQDLYLSGSLDCKKKEEDSPSKSQGNLNKAKTRKQVVDRLYQLPRLAKDDSWPPKDAMKEDVDESGYTLREKLFYSALLYCEMYETMQDMEELYLGGHYPEPREKILKREQQTGFGISDIGRRKLGFSEWDRPLPPLPKISPYITDFPVVGSRKRYVRPSGRVYMYRRSIQKARPMYLAIKAPVDRKSPIKVFENASRVKGILELLASRGNCLALLPNVASIFHLSDTLLQKLEDTRPRDWERLPRLYRGTENKWICEQAKNLFRPHGLPPQIAKIPPLISFSDGLKLREICKQVREQHWSYICERKLQFREFVWPLMHVDRIPCGNLRESFIYSFQTLLPEKTNFPVIRTDPLPW